MVSAVTAQVAYIGQKVYFNPTQTFIKSPGKGKGLFTGFFHCRTDSYRKVDLAMPKTNSLAFGSC